MFKKNPNFRRNYNTLKSIRNNIRIDVRHGFNQIAERLNKKNPKLSNICDKIDGLTIEEMTSKEYANDLRAWHGSHENKLHDILYMDTFREAILGNAHLFKDKIVLDIRCGLGMLSMLSILAGAKHVYAIDNSNVTQWTKRIIQDNKLSNKISVIKGSIGDIQLPVNKVDIIVSTYFGQSLFIENALDDVIDARDKWLKKKGLIFPDRCTLYLAALDDDLQRDRSNFWQHVYTFRMQAMIKAVNIEPYQLRVQPDKIITTACPVKHINLYTAHKTDYKQFDGVFRLEALRNGYIGSFFTYFDVEFTECHKPLTISMKPNGIPKAWHSLVFFLNFHGKFQVETDNEIYGTFSMSAVSNDFRKIDWKIFVFHENDKGALRQTWTFETR